jgi:hypothetical protein
MVTAISESLHKQLSGEIHARATVEMSP